MHGRSANIKAKGNFELHIWLASANGVENKVVALQIDSMVTFSGVTSTALYSHIYTFALFVMAYVMTC